MPPTHHYNLPSTLLRDSPQPIEQKPLASGPNLVGVDQHQKTNNHIVNPKRKRHSLRETATTTSKRSSPKEKMRSATSAGIMRDSPEEDDELQVTNKKGKGRSASQGGGGLTGFTSCEACRRGKRKCEPSPLVPPDHPDAARLPCARCRRFATECVRVKVARRKGPAPIDLSAISDAAHGYKVDPSLQPTATRRSSGLSEHAHESERTASISTSSSHALMSPPGGSMSLDSIDQVIPGPVIENVMNLFFDYVYPLTPCIHRPTFVADLTARRDRRDPAFFALALCIVGSTLVQVPRSLINMDKHEVEELAMRCVKTARAKIAYIWEEPTPTQLTFVVICYLEGIVHLFMGNNTAHVVTTAQANQLALAMRLNEEASYKGLDPIESEMRRRVYWLLFQADKSSACTRARTICLRLDDANPPDRTPLITGFNIVTNLFRILNDVLILQRRKTPRSMDDILFDLQQVHLLRERTIQISFEVPDPYKLRMAYDSRSALPAVDWENKLLARFVDFFRSAGDSVHALNSFLVMQGNILATQHLVRLVLLQTRQSLLTQLAVFTPIASHGLAYDEQAEDIACELLDGLNSLPVECVATNGPSLVQKVRFVAIHLMDASHEPAGAAMRAQKLLMQFLSVLGVIEGMYTFGKDISAE
ncbi:hypothetical protein IAT38_000376 [Cryptococcus sp. DSM 104549]